MAKGVARIEPKVFFANEVFSVTRTWLSWLSTSALISTSGLSLMNLSPMEKSWRWARVAGALIVPFSIFFLSYGLYTFLWRDRLMKQRSPGPYQAYAGLVLCTAVFFISLLINYIVAFDQHHRHH